MALEIGALLSRRAASVEQGGWQQSLKLDRAGESWEPGAGLASSPSGAPCRDRHRVSA